MTSTAKRKFHAGIEIVPVFVPFSDNEVQWVWKVDICVKSVIGTEFGAYNGHDVVHSETSQQRFDSPLMAKKSAEKFSKEVLDAYERGTAGSYVFGK